MAYLFSIKYRFSKISYDHFFTVKRGENQLLVKAKSFAGISLAGGTFAKKMWEGVCKGSKFLTQIITLPNLEKRGKHFASSELLMPLIIENKKTKKKGGKLKILTVRDCLKFDNQKFVSNK